jgi:uncharacterized protein
MNEIIIILTILFISTLVRSTFGFGDALIAMPLLAVFISIKVVTPLVALIAFTIAIYIVIQDFKKIEFKNIWKLILSSIIGIPIGLYFLDGVSEEIIKLILGIIIIVFALYNLLKPNLIKLSRSFWAYLFGFLAGIIGAAYNTNGPIIVIYGTTQKWNPKEFRATLQGYFLTTGIFVIIGHLLAGNITNQVMRYYLYVFPIVILAIILGGFFNKRFDTEKFKKAIYIFLFITGILLIVKSMMNVI